MKERKADMEPIFYTVQSINGDYAQLVTDSGQPHSITMFLLPEGTTVGSRLKLEPVSYTHLDVYKRQVCVHFQRTAVGPQSGSTAWIYR